MWDLTAVSFIRRYWVHLIMSEPYRSIPRAGGPHLKKIDREHSSLNVSAQPAPDFRKPRFSWKKKPAFQVSYNEERGSYRVRKWKSGLSDQEQGYTELSRHSTTAELASALEEAAPSMGFVVLENSDTGEVFMEPEVNLRGDWTHEGRFDRFTTFKDEAAAAEYAKSRQSK